MAISSSQSHGTLKNEPVAEGGSIDQRPFVVVAFDDLAGKPLSEWRWFEADFPEVRWEFVSSAPANALERRLRRAGLQRTRCAWEAIRRVKQSQAKLLISIEPELTYRCVLFSRWTGVRVPHVTWAFNFAGLPRSRLRLGLMKAGFRDVDRFIISSAMESRRYGELFAIPPEKFDLHLWSVGDPEVSHPEEPVISGDYICALGSNSRDYRTLVEAMVRLPEIRLVIVTRPEAVAGLNLPPNVEIRSGVPLGVTHNILAHSRLMVLPLADGQTPNGHVTLVNAMKLVRASVVTDSEGIADYVRDGIDALTCSPGSSESMAEAIRALWNDPARTERFGAEAREFASTHCSEAAAKNKVLELLVQYEVIQPGRPPFH
jgi:glycosyltransferase involved in cell wall biosynthesis